MNDNQLPIWATVGATVYVRPHGSYGRVSTYNRAEITRVTKTSVFVKQTGSSREQRFVPMRGNWFKGESVLEEYGNRTSSWARPAYLFAGDSDTVKSGLKAGEVVKAYHAAVRTLNEFTTNNPTEDRKASAENGIAALQNYLEILKQNEVG